MSGALILLCHTLNNEQTVGSCILLQLAGSMRSLPERKAGVPRRIVELRMRDLNHGSRVLAATRFLSF